MAQTPPECEFEYTVQKDDWLSGLQTDELGRVTTVRDERPRDSVTRTLREPLQSWRPCAVYVGNVSSTIEVGLGGPPDGGALLRRVTMRVRTDHDASTTDYWTMEVRWRASTVPAIIGPRSAPGGPA